MKNLLDQPSKVEDREERFGDIAQKKGYITWPQLLEALELQIEEAVEGKTRFIGEILCDLQFITKLKLRDVLESMTMVQQKKDNHKARYYSSASGCLVTIVGFILFFHWPIGTIAGIAVMFIGKQMLFREPTNGSFRMRRRKNKL